MCMYVCMYVSIYLLIYLSICIYSVYKCLLIEFFRSKGYLLCKLQFCVSYLHKKQDKLTAWIVRTGNLDHFPNNFWCSIALFNIPKFF